MESGVWDDCCRPLWAPTHSWNLEGCVHTWGEGTPRREQRAHCFSLSIYFQTNCLSIGFCSLLAVPTNGIHYLIWDTCCQGCVNNNVSYCLHIHSLFCHICHGSYLFCIFFCFILILLFLQDHFLNYYKLLWNLF